MKVICDTTPFIALASVDKIFLLRDIYSSVIVPEAVIEEINEQRIRFSIRLIEEISSALKED